MLKIPLCNATVVPTGSLQLLVDNSIWGLETSLSVLGLSINGIRKWATLQLFFLLHYYCQVATILKFVSGSSVNQFSLKCFCPIGKKKYLVSVVVLEQERTVCYTRKGALMRPCIALPNAIFLNGFPERISLILILLLNSYSALLPNGNLIDRLTPFKIWILLSCNLKSTFLLQTLTVLVIFAAYYLTVVSANWVVQDTICFTLEEKCA